MTGESDELVSGIARCALDKGLRVAAAESLTSGALLSALGAGEQASTWFAGGVVAYGKDVKFGLLGVDPGPVVTARCAVQMADGVARVTGADVAVATTGAGGPEPEDGEEPGTVFIAVTARGSERVERFAFGGDPAEVLRCTIHEALALLADALN